MIKADDLINKFPALLEGDVDAGLEFSGIGAAENFSTGDLIVCDSEASLKLIFANSHSPSLVITHPSLLQNIPSHIPSLGTKNPRVAHALIKQLINDYQKFDQSFEKGIHSSAVIHPSANIADSSQIGANVTIGANVVIGENSVVRSNVVIEHNSRIGNDCTIHSQVNIGYASQIGDRVIIRSGATIGGEGFGFAPDENKKYHRVPHTGFVEIHDDVHIGSNSNVDRGTYGKTLLKRGSKLDSLVHIAHNVELGEDCIMVSQAGIAGSTTVGNRVIISGQIGILDHLKVCDDVVLVHRAGVTADITEKGVWAGLPAKPMKEYVKSLNTDKRLSKKIKMLEKKIEALTKMIEKND